MAYLIDTCVFSEFTKPRPSKVVEAWFSTVEEGSEHASVLTLGEIERGIGRLAMSKRRRALERWFAELRGRLDGYILAVDGAVALEWGRMTARAELAGHPLPVVDALIGATAIIHGLTVVTRNTSDIARTGAPVIDPWSG